MFHVPGFVDAQEYQRANGLDDQIIDDKDCITCCCMGSCIVSIKELW